MDERRRFERRPTAIRVEISHTAFGKIIGYTQDISDGGASVRLESELRPPKGTEVEVVFKKVSGVINEEPVKMTIVHQHRSVVGLMFSGPRLKQKLF